MQDRERFSSRLGFILISAGCAIGLGNVWRFPYIAGQYGGAFFVILYIIFLLVLGLPIMVMEFSVGRAGQGSSAVAFRRLEPAGSKWHIFGYISIAGNYILMMFYTTVAGWMLSYCFKMAAGTFDGLNAAAIESVFSSLTGNPAEMVFWMSITVLLCFGVCSLGLKNGVERITKVMMVCLLVIMLFLAVRSVTLPGAGEGLRFYLIPDLQRLRDTGIANIVFAAMGQAFFTLSIGIGSMAIFGSYLDKSRRLLSESLSITLLDTFVAIVSGLIIFPACFAYDINPGQGPGLIFVTLPNVFRTMPNGNLWGCLFFIFMSFAALSTVIAIFQNIIAYAQDTFSWSRKKAILINIPIIFLISLPCVFGFNFLSVVTPFGPGTSIFDLEDFIVSNNLLPLGSIVYILFCTSRYGWGFSHFIKEANTGAGLHFPRQLRIYLTWILPLIIGYIFLQGYYTKFF